ncbi:MAG: VWA-like domain-containing protein [Desulfurococcaceae archaeon]
MTEKIIREKFEGAKMALAIRRPFWYFLLQSIRVTYDPDEDADVIVEPWGIILGWRAAEKNMVKALIYGMYHIVQGHPFRKNSYIGSPDKFDLACEIKRSLDMEAEEANYNIKICAKSKGWDKKSTEEIAWELEEGGDAMARYLKPATNMKIVLSGRVRNKAGVVVINQGEDMMNTWGSADYGEAYKNILRKVVEAKIFADMAGRGEPLADRLIDSLFARKEPWFKVLETAVKEHFRKTLMTYQKISRRDANLPGRKWYGGRLWVLVDVSGSISDEEYKKFCETIYGMVKAGIEVIFVKWDTEAEIVGVVKTLSDLMKKAKVRGYGGTTPDCLLSVLDKFKQNDVAVILTDGRWVDYGRFAKWVKGKKIILATGGVVPDKVKFWKTVKVR